MQHIRLQHLLTVDDLRLREVGLSHKYSRPCGHNQCGYEDKYRGFPPYYIVPNLHPNTWQQPYQHTSSSLRRLWDKLKTPLFRLVNTPLQSLAISLQYQ